MSMKSRDVIKAALVEKLGSAVNQEQPDAIAEAFTDILMEQQETLMKDFRQYAETQDESILTKRGVRPLTSKEKQFYEKFIEAAKTGDIQAAFTGLEAAFPETIIDAALDDIQTNHPLLSKLNFMNTATLTKILVNATGAQLATWGPITDKFKEQLSGAIKAINLTKSKLSAFFLISKDMLEPNIGPAWVDSYVRQVLVESIAMGLEKAIITGTGKDEPIGMDRSVADDVTVTAGVYPQKTPIVVSDLSPATMGDIAAQLAEGPTGNYRIVPEIAMIVNPVDYFRKVMPATTIRAADGSYAREIFPYPTAVIQSAQMAKNRALFGLTGKYFVGVGTGGIGGKIEFSDHVKAIEDERVYLTKLYGDGRALDNNAFILADITDLKPVPLEVIVRQSAAPEVKAAK